MHLPGIVRRLLRRPASPPAVGAVAAEFWDKQMARQSVYWTAYPQVREYVNELITGVGWLWPLIVLKAGWAFRPLPRVISIGCGTGSMERELRNVNAATKVIGYDVSKASIREARRLARREKLSGISYRVRDCNQLRLPANRYDGAFFHASLHHISDPDQLLEETSRSLKPHGMVYVDDYVGPSRDEWNDDHLKHARALFDLVPEEVKIVPINPPFDYTDPSEMIRSSRTLPALRERFEILHYRPYWGNVLFPILCAVDGVMFQQPKYAPVLTQLIEAERELVARGELTDPMFAIVVARKKVSAGASAV